MKRHLFISAPLAALGASLLFAALASGESPPVSEKGGFSQPTSPITIPLALPRLPETTAVDLPERPSAPEADLDSQTRVSMHSAATPPVGPAPTEKSTTDILSAAVADIAAREPQGPMDTDPTGTERPPEADAPKENWLTREIKGGDTLAQIFSDLGLTPYQLHRIVNSSKSAKKLAQIKPGQKIRIRLDTENEIRELVHEISPIRSRRILAEEDGYKIRILERSLEYGSAHAYGVINTSLFASAQKAGLSDQKTMELANIFGWDIDFALEIRAGDQFSVVYREDYLDGQKLRDGPILAAEFVNQGKTYRAVRYVDKNGRADYFTPEGKSVRKAFLRTPVKIARISSRFNLRRKHPILNRIRAHKGVDYAAPKGTPIRASGDGRISLRGRKGGYGKTVIIEHGGGISTLYGHMSRYARSKRRGSRVKQGDVIGYIGKTGLATGYHLHYEFRVNGVHRNPLTVKLPAAKPIARDLKGDFEHQIQPLIAQLDALSRTMVAKAQ